MALVPYAQAVGSLMHSSVYITKSDITYTVNSLAQFLSTFDPRHWQGIKCTLCYIKGIVNLSIKYQHQINGNIFYAFSNVDWARDQNMRRSTSSYCFLLASGVVTWLARNIPL